MPRVSGGGGPSIFIVAVSLRDKKELYNTQNIIGTAA